jgi:hypothetical protein
MKTYLVSVTECIDPDEDINSRVSYIVPSNSEEDALDRIMRNLSKSMLMDGDGYPVVMEIVAPIIIGRS